MKPTARIILGIATASAGMGILTHAAFGSTSRIHVSNTGDGASSEVRVHNSVQGSTIIDGQTVTQGSKETKVVVNGEEVCTGNSGECNYDKDGVKVNISNKEGTTQSVTQKSETNFTNDITVGNNSDDANDQDEEKTKVERKAARKEQRKAVRKAAREALKDTKRGHLIYVDESMWDILQKFFNNRS